MNKRTIAKVAVSAAIYTIDRPYSYLVPENLVDTARPGSRVTVPFGKGNKRAEGFILECCEEEDERELKAIEAVLDETPVLTGEQIKLALWMRDRFFCTAYEAVRVMIPSGLYIKDGKRKIGDKTETYVSLAVPAEDALAIAAQKRLRAPMQSEILKLLAAIGEAGIADILEFTGASRQSVNALVKAELVSLELWEAYRRPVKQSYAEADEIELNPHQREVYDGLARLMDSGKAEAALLYGVTGSGKTLIYIMLAKEAVRRGKTAIVLVPEIGLTPQFVSVFSSHFGDTVAVLHSSLSAGERYDEWKRIKSGAVKVVIGTRSAVFAPLSDLGLICIDEEQEHTYKSENSPRYSARDVAKFRTVKNGALLVLGSATPDVESMYSAREGKYRLFELRDRFNKRPLPQVITADMRAELKSGNGGLYSSTLRREMEKNLEAGEQTILFLNRRGANSAVLCGECGYTFTCPNCSVSKTYHSVGRRLLCHYCGHSQPLPDRCPECGGKLKFIGAGTQKAEEELLGIFPETKIVRMDADTVARVGSHEKLLQKFREEKIPFLIGTQMVTKGLDFENVTLVGVLSADSSLYAGDYRARERTFSLITQVVGRSGRGEKTGRAVIQTFTPDNEIIGLAARQDYSGFYEREIELRKVMKAPPIKDIVAVTVSGVDEALVLRGAVSILEALRHYFEGDGETVVLGPSPAGIAKVNNRYRYKLTIACRNTRQLRDTVFHVLKEFSNDKTFRGLVAFADSDPLY